MAAQGHSLRVLENNNEAVGTLTIGNGRLKKPNKARLLGKSTLVLLELPAADRESNVTFDLVDLASQFPRGIDITDGAADDDLRIPFKGAGKTRRNGWTPGSPAAYWRDQGSTSPSWSASKDWAAWAPVQEAQGWACCYSRKSYQAGWPGCCPLDEGQEVVVPEVAFGVSHSSRRTGTSGTQRPRRDTTSDIQGEAQHNGTVPRRPPRPDESVVCLARIVDKRAGLPPLPKAISLSYLSQRGRLLTVLVAVAAGVKFKLVDDAPARRFNHKVAVERILDEDFLRERNFMLLARRRSPNQESEWSKREADKAGSMAGVRARWSIHPRVMVGGVAACAALGSNSVIGEPPTFDHSGMLGRENGEGGGVAEGNGWWVVGTRGVGDAVGGPAAARKGSSEVTEGQLKRATPQAQGGPGAVFVHFAVGGVGDEDGGEGEQRATSSAFIANSKIDEAESASICLCCPKSPRPSTSSRRSLAGAIPPKSATASGWRRLRAKAVNRLEPHLEAREARIPQTASGVVKAWLRYGLAGADCKSTLHSREPEESEAWERQHREKDVWAPASEYREGVAMGGAPLVATTRPLDVLVGWGSNDKGTHRWTLVEYTLDSVPKP
ncbi:hypothetical protein FA13DRAFT_1844636 [Coprinellus micaceus]|uniref:Uncharacterized protein n=1 Tax=Coprinellus micaceus TaxID=71717 RepID=A0A4Y7SD82_COPMI|nr:hypothetical protein FA13DRAFT_1844636 [Coprinellus micaceus]